MQGILDQNILYTNSNVRQSGVYMELNSDKILAEIFNSNESETWLSHILEKSTSCPNTTGIEWKTVLYEVKDFVLASEGYIKVSFIIKWGIHKHKPH